MDLLGVATFELHDARRAIPRAARRAVQFVVLFRPYAPFVVLRDCVTPMTLVVPFLRSSYTSFEPFVRLSSCYSRRVVVTPFMPFPVSCFVLVLGTSTKQSKHHAHASRWLFLLFAAGT